MKKNSLIPTTSCDQGKQIENFYKKITQII